MGAVYTQQDIEFLLLVAIALFGLIILFAIGLCLCSSKDMPHPPERSEGGER